MNVARLAVAALACAAAAIPSAAQVPPPPLLPGQGTLVEALVLSLVGKDVAGYTRLLADDVEVFEDGKRTASGKAAWMRTFSAKLGAEGVSFEVRLGAMTTGRVLLVEHFNSVASWGGDVPAECCQGTDAVAYDLTDGRISRISRLTGGPDAVALRGRVRRPTGTNARGDRPRRAETQ